MTEHPCAKGLTQACFKAHPKWARQAFAYKLMHLLLPKQVTARLPKGLRNVFPNLPPGWDPTADIPAYLYPGYPEGWSPGDPPPLGVIIPPGTVFPPGWLPGDPAPPGVIIPPGTMFPPGWVYPREGILPPLFTGPWEPGPVHGPSPGAGLKEYAVSILPMDIELTQNTDADWATARDTLSNAQASAGQSNFSNPVSATCFDSIYDIDRLIFKFSLAEIPSGANVVSASLSLKVDSLGAYMSAIAQVCYPIWNNPGDYLSFVGDPIAYAFLTVGENVLDIPDILSSQIQGFIGMNYFIMIREQDHDYFNGPPEEGINYTAQVCSYGTPPELTPTLNLNYWA